MRKIKKHRLSIAITAVVGIIGVGLLVFFIIWQVQRGIFSLSDGNQQSLLNNDPSLRLTDLVTNLQEPWDMAFPNQDIMLYALKGGEIRGLLLSTGETWPILSLRDVLTDGDRGLLSIAVDYDIYANNYIYVCYSADHPQRGNEVRVSRFEISKDFKTLDKQVDIVTGIPSPTNRNQGCAVRMDRLGYLWIGTGDGGSATAPQDPKSLGGKVLRVSRNGNPVDGNAPQPFDPRIFSYGHRNIVGIALLAAPLLNGAYGYTSGAGGDQDDEVNPLVVGNFGWDPNSNGAYSDSAPRTDIQKYPDAVKALWSSGQPSIGMGSLERLARKRWQAWQGFLVLPSMKGSTRLIELSAEGSLIGEKPIFTEYDSIRAVSEGQEGDLYLATSGHGSQDKIVRVRVLCTVCD